LTGSIFLFVFFFLVFKKIKKTMKGGRKKKAVLLSFFFFISGFYLLYRSKKTGWDTLYVREGKEGECVYAWLVCVASIA
jgi:hypothetical protein